MRQDTEDRKNFEHLMGVPTIGLHAADWGWMHRSRLFWLRACQPGPTHAALQRNIREVGNWKMPPHTSASKDAGAWLIRYKGPKVPAQVEWSDGHRPLHLDDAPAVTTKLINEQVKYTTGRFMALTKEFPHPSDCPGRRSTAIDQSRFKTGGGRFP